MNILYLIGNGFDLNAGFDTRATDFYSFLNKHYMDSKYSKYVHELKIINDDIQKDKKWNSDKWADYEIGLGIASKLFDDSKSFINALIGLSFVFKSFIDDIQSKIDNYNINGESLRGFSDCISSLFRNVLTEEDRIKLDSVYASNVAHNFNFVSFNYTSLLDVIIDKVTNENFNLITFPSANGYSKTSWPLHIHGYLKKDEAPLIGFYNNELIQNKSFKDDQLVMKYIRKSTMNVRLKNNKIKSFCEYINKANIICCFGLSIGESDDEWWKKIGSWLSNQNVNNRYLIICKPKSNDELSSIIPASYPDDMDNEIDNFITVSKISEKLYSNVSQKILIANLDKEFKILGKK